VCITGAGSVIVFVKHQPNPKMKPNVLRFFLPDKPTLILWVPLFGVLMWYGISHHLEDMGLYTAAVALAALGLSGRAVLVVRKWREWRRSKGRHNA
jgi:membrane protein DedA with SNARE-associated domain